MNNRYPSYRSFQPSNAISSANKKMVKSANTRAEIILRRSLRKAGMHFRINDLSIPGKPDLTFPRYKVAIFCDGDFWHGRDWRQLRKKLMNRANSSYWIAKIIANRKRDRAVNHLLSKMGWIVVRIWETDILSDIDRVSSSLLLLLHKGKLVKTSCRGAASAADTRKGNGALRKKRKSLTYRPRDNTT
ncbi:MAG: very short patch repair endonuclease [Candidatus Zixiibacteriota bacterium]